MSDRSILYLAEERTQAEIEFSTINSRRAIGPVENDDADSVNDMGTLFSQTVTAGDVISTFQLIFLKNGDERHLFLFLQRK